MDRSLTFFLARLRTWPAIFAGTIALLVGLGAATGQADSELEPLRELAAEYGAHGNGSAVTIRLLELAEAGNSEAMYLLGLNMMPDHFAPRAESQRIATLDFEQAVAWLERAAEAGNTNAMLVLFRLRHPRGGLFHDMERLADFAEHVDRAPPAELPDSAAVFDEEVAWAWFTEATRAGSRHAVEWGGLRYMLRADHPDLTADEMAYAVAVARDRYSRRVIATEMPDVHGALLYDRLDAPGLLIPSLAAVPSASRAENTLAFQAINRTLGATEAVDEAGEPLTCGDGYTPLETPRWPQTIELRVACARSRAVAHWERYLLSEERRVELEAPLDSGRRAELDRLVDDWLAGFAHPQP